MKDLGDEAELFLHFKVGEDAGAKLVSDVQVRLASMNATHKRHFAQRPLRETCGIL